MLEKRRQGAKLSVSDLPHLNDGSDPENPESSRVIVKLQDIILMLLDAIRHSTQDNQKLETDVFKTQLDEQFARLRKTFDAQELTDIEEKLKQLIFRQYDMEKIYRQNQYAEFSKIVETLIGGIDEFAADNSDFNAEIGSSLFQIGRVVELDDLKQIRQQISRKLIQAKKAIRDNQKRSSEKQAELSQKVEQLEMQLSRAEDEILIDGLTQAFNRRAFDARIEEEAKRSQMLERGFGLVLFDVDHFKSINDTHGHLIGDRLLVALANHTREVFRVDDFVARYGGEEFAVILHAPSLEIVWSVAERLRTSVAEKSFRYRKDGKAETFRIAISGGVAWFQSDDTTESLINRADECLYLAKRSGRNQMRMETELEKAPSSDMSPVDEAR